MSEKKKFISLAEYNPAILVEWHPTKNSDFTPQSISYGSAIKIWWVCAKGHEWEATPNTRTRGRGCPECAKQQRAITKRNSIIAKRGSLASRNPILASEWHPTKNGILTPHDITPNSSEKVWWKCLKDEKHEWEAPVNSRNSGVGCPVCSGHKVVAGVNDLATIRPDLALQWHPTKNGELKPTEVTIGNGNNVWWKCEKGHEWNAKISNRGNGNNCPICIGKKVFVGYNDLATVMPNLAKEWHPTKNGALTPKDVVPGSNKIVWWQCERGHEWQTSVAHRRNGNRCPKCFGESKTSFPEQAIFFYLRQLTTAYNRYMLDSKTEIDVYLPEYKIGIEYDGAFFHEGEKAEQREKRKQEKLDKLGIKLIRVRELVGDINEYTIYSPPRANDIELTKTLKELMNRISFILQNTFNIDIDIARDRNKIYDQYIKTEKENSLVAVNPELAKEWHSTKNGTLLPEHISSHSNKKVWWRCSKGHEWQAVINSRKDGVGCPICSGHKVLIGYNDLATVNSSLALEWHPTKNGNLLPQDVTAHSNKFIWWLCHKKHEWRAKVCIRSKGIGCPICSGHAVLVGYNDLATVNPSLALEWHQTKNKINATDVTCGSDKKVWWQCDRGHEWEATISSRSAGCGCPYCAGQKLLVGFNDLSTRNPELTAEWHPSKNGELTPRDVMPGTNKKVWWLCDKGHEWKQSVNVRNGGNGCPYCANQLVLKGYNDLATLNPLLASEWHPTKNGNLTPSEFMPGSNKKAWWLCKNGHEWQAVISSRNKGAGCMVCYRLRSKVNR
ncbi:MAG: hypothetical protein E7675_06520 [Ruminococcaceae bacterium]|nr:hypothetical protein [Oscillospiraceae bacterium]